MDSDFDQSRVTFCKASPWDIKNSIEISDALLIIITHILYQASKRLRSCSGITRFSSSQEASMAAIPHPLLLPQHLNVLLLYWIQISSLPVRNFNFRLRENTGSWQYLPFVYHNSVRLPQFQKVYHGSMIDPENIIFHIQKISRKISVILENPSFLYEIEQFFKIDQVFEIERFFQNWPLFRVRKWYHTSDEYAVDPQHASPLTCPGRLWPRAPIPFGNKGSSGKNCGGNEIPGSFA